MLQILREGDGAQIPGMLASFVQEGQWTTKTWQNMAENENMKKKVHQDILFRSLVTHGMQKPIWPKKVSKHDTEYRWMRISVEITGFIFYLSRLNVEFESISWNQKISSLHLNDKLCSYDSHSEGWAQNCRWKFCLRLEHPSGLIFACGKFWS